MKILFINIFLSTLIFCNDKYISNWGDVSIQNESLSINDQEIMQIINQHTNYMISIFGEINKTPFKIIVSNQEKDVILSLIFGTPSSVSAVGIPVLTKTADIANARIEFDTGAIANVTASRVSTSTQRKFRVFHEGQYLSMDFGGGEVRLITHDSTQGSGQLALQEQRWSLQNGDALLAESEAFISAIEAHSPCQGTGYDGGAALELAESIITDMQARAL